MKCQVVSEECHGTEQMCVHVLFIESCDKSSMPLPEMRTPVHQPFIGMYVKRQEPPHSVHVWATKLVFNDPNFCHVALFVCQTRPKYNDYNFFSMPDHQSTVKRICSDVGAGLFYGSLCAKLIHGVYLGRSVADANDTGCRPRHHIIPLRNYKAHAGDPASQQT